MTNCIKCDISLNSHTAVGDHAKPDKGDITICGHCKTLMVFDEELKLRAPTESELEEIKQDTDLTEQLNIANSVVDIWDSLKKE